VRVASRLLPIFLSGYLTISLSHAQLVLHHTHAAHHILNLIESILVEDVGRSRTSVAVGAEHYDLFLFEI
jgi:hypothetical protein